MPAPGLTYEVAAQLRVQGNFAKGMASMARQVPGVNRDFQMLERSISKVGRTIQGTTAATAASWARMGTLIGAVAGGAGLALATRNGLAFNRTMEDARLQVATMYQMFNFASNDARVLSGETSQWEANIGQARGAMGELYNIAKKTPATFKNLISVYQNAAAGLSTQTEDLSRHMEFMSRAALLGGLAGGDYSVLGAQVGRIIAGSAGAEMNIWKVLQKPILEAGKRMGVFNNQLAMGGDLTQRFNELTGDNRLKIMMEAMEKIGPEIAKAYGESMAGITSTTMSAIEGITGEFTSPLYEGFRKWLVHINKEGGILGDASMDKYRQAADFAGTMLADTAGKIFSSLERGAVFLRDNWEDAMRTTHRTFQGIVLAIKLALVTGATRLGTGLAMRGAGAAMRGAQQIPGAVRGIADRARVGRIGGLRAYARARRGMRGGSLLDRVHGMVAGFRRMGDNIAGGFDNILRSGVNLAPMLGRLGFSLVGLGVAILPMIAMAGGAILVFGGLALAIAGVAAYFIENWNAIAASFQQFLKTGHAALRPVIKAGMVFWAGLVAIGEALLGGATGGDMMETALRLATGAMNGLIGVVRGFVAAIIPMLDAFSGFLGMIGQDELAASATDLGSRLAMVSARMKEVEMDDLAIDRKTAEMMGKLQGLAGLGGAGAGKTPGGKVPKSGVTINHLEVHQDLRDTDPDRLLAAFVEPLEKIAAMRGQAYNVLDEGV